MTSKHKQHAGHTHHPKGHHAPVKIARAKATKMTSGLVALSSAAVFAVYAAGYAKTKAAADRLEEASARRTVPGDGELGARGRAGAPPTTAAVPDQAAGRTGPADAPAAPGPGTDRVNSSGAATQSGPSMPMTAAPAAVQIQQPSAVPGPQTATPGHSSSMSNASASAAVSEPATAASEHKDLEPVASATASMAPAPVAEVASGGVPAAAAAAAAAPAPPQPAPKPQTAAFKDGTYTGWGTCRHGDIQAEVVVAGGRIASARISQCWTRYTCSWLDPVVPQVVQRQSPAVDYVSGATQSTDAFYFAVLDALLKAK